MKKVIKYISFFLGLIFALFILQALVIHIPNKYIENNIKESIDYYGDRKYYLMIDNDKIKYSDNKYLIESLMIDDNIDLLTLNMIWNANNKYYSYFKAQVLMKFFLNIFMGYSGSLERCVTDDTVVPNFEYSRYWHGSIIYIKPLLTIFNVKEIKLINIIIITLLTLYLLYLIFKKSKGLLIAFIGGLIAINFAIIPLCFEYFFIFIVMLISSIVTMKIYNKKKEYFTYLLIASGLCSCFFDFLTCETLALTIPLLLYVYLNNKEKKIGTKENILFIIKSTLIWLVSYAMTYVIKWILSIIVLGFNQVFNIGNMASIRIYDLGYDYNLFEILGNIFKNIFCNLFPFNILNKSNLIAFISVGVVITLIYILLLNKEKRKLINSLLLISMIGIGRMLVLFAHTYQHSFFDYRALLPLVIVIILIVCEGVNYEVKSTDTLSKRGRDIEKSNKVDSRLSKKRKTK